MKDYQVMPILSDEDFQALKSDIAAHGILVPLEFDDEGNILDGYHRKKAWDELRSDGIKVGDFPRIVRGGMTEEEKEHHAVALNLIRRHLTTEQKTPYWSRWRQNGMTYQAIADMSGVGKQTVRRAVGPNGPTQPEKVSGKDGKKYPSKKQKAIFANDNKQQDRANKASLVLDDAPDKVLDVKRAERIAREQENEKRRETENFPEPITIGNAEIRHGDFTEVLSDITDNSIDLICTDPPYSKKYLPQWEQLFVFASMKLKPGGFLIAYCGQSIIDQVFRLSDGLEYVWTMAQLNTASKKNINHQRHIYSRWKPVLIFCKPSFSPLNWANDILDGGEMEKEGHDWQQSQAEAEYIISNFSIPGSLIIDPFVGSGTVAAAAQLLGRAFIGCDIDAACVSKTLERLNATN